MDKSGLLYKNLLYIYRFCLMMEARTQVGSGGHYRGRFGIAPRNGSNQGSLLILKPGGTMDLYKVLAELRFERAQLALAIESLEKLFSNRQKRGRPSRSAMPRAESRDEDPAGSAADTMVAQSGV